MKTKIKIIVVGFILFQLCFQPIISQEYEYVPFPQSDAIWSEIYYFREGEGSIRSYERFAITGEDTVINNRNYKKIYMFMDSVFNKEEASYVGGLREDDSKKVWFKGEKIVHLYKPLALEEDELLLYDFSLNVGDTVKAGNFDVLFHEWEGSLIVNEIDTISIGNSLRKRIKFQPFSWINVAWIEGIGNLDGLFFTSRIMLPTCSCEKNELIGFKHHGEILYFNDSFSSFFPTPIQSVNNKKQEITITPFFDNAILFNFENLNLSFIHIFNVAGILQDSYNVNMRKEFMLSTDHYIPGIYIYHSADHDGNSYSGKFYVK
jgi:hypothetical protein